MTFRPEDTFDMHGQPQSAHFKVPGVPRIQGYRYPAPGDRPVTPHIPKQDYEGEGRDPFNTSYYSRDVKRNSPTKVVYNILSEKDAKASGVRIDGSLSAQAALPPGALDVDKGMGSPGNKSVFATGPSSYDDTGGLRAAMSTSHEKMQASLKKYEPTQLVRYEWEDRQEELIKEWEAKGLPPCPGGGVRWKVPERSRVASW